jgi:hypothetical protein
VCVLTDGQKESAKQYIIKTTDRMIELTTNSQETFLYRSNYRIFKTKSKRNWLKKNDKFERNIIISQLTLYDENQEQLQRDSNILEFTQLSQVASILLATPATHLKIQRLF